jgi:hypothetical protein
MAYPRGDQGGHETQAQWTLPHADQLPRGNTTKAENEVRDEVEWEQEGEREDTSVSISISQPGNSGFKSTLERLRYTATKPNILEKELQWQQKGKQNHHEQDLFKEEILAQCHLRPFAIMCKIRRSSQYAIQSGNSLGNQAMRRRAYTESAWLSLGIAI